MEQYIKMLQSASGAVWTVFKNAALTGRSPDRAFEELTEKFKGTTVEGYVADYTNLCKNEIPNIKDSKRYFDNALLVTKDMWNVFKKHVVKLYEGEMTDGDWNRLIKDATDVGYKRWDPDVKEYARGYSCLCVTELDRHYQKMHHVKEDWYKFI